MEFTTQNHLYGPFHQRLFYENDYGTSSGEQASRVSHLARPFRLTVLWSLKYFAGANLR